MSPLEYAFAALAVAVGAAVQGSVGFGVNLVCAPVLGIIDTDLIPGVPLVIGMVLSVLLAVRERAGTEWWGVRWALVGRVPGTVAGAAIVAALPERGVATVFASLVLVAVALSASGLHVAPSRPSLLGAGALSGLMGTATSIGGPPIALVYQRAAGATIRGTLSGYFGVGTVMSIAVLAVAGEFGTGDVVASLALVPPLLVGLAVSRLAAPVLDRGWTRPAVLAVSAASALFVLARELL